jgi:chromate transport protein ChrA
MAEATNHDPDSSLSFTTIAIMLATGIGLILAGWLGALLATLVEFLGYAVITYTAIVVAIGIFGDEDEAESARKPMQAVRDFVAGREILKKGVQAAARRFGKSA